MDKRRERAVQLLGGLAIGGATVWLLGPVDAHGQAVDGSSRATAVSPQATPSSISPQVTPTLPVAEVIATAVRDPALSGHPGETPEQEINRALDLVGRIRRALGLRP